VPQRALRRVGVDVHHRRHQTRSLGHALAVLDALLARGGDEDLHLPARAVHRPQDVEVQADLVQREGDVLLGLQAHELFELVLAQAAGQDQASRHHRRRRQGQGHAPLARAAAGDNTPHGCDDGVEVLDLALADPALLQRLGAQALERPAAARRRAELGQAHAAGADVQPHQRCTPPAEKPRQELHVRTSLSVIGSC
jgi:hypothetical protein